MERIKSRVFHDSEAFIPPCRGKTRSMEGLNLKLEVKQVIRQGTLQ